MFDINGYLVTNRGSDTGLGEWASDKQLVTGCGLTEPLGQVFERNRLCHVHV